MEHKLWSACIIHSGGLRSPARGRIACHSDMPSIPPPILQEEQQFSIHDELVWDPHIAPPAQGSILPLICFIQRIVKKSYKRTTHAHINIY